MIKHSLTVKRVFLNTCLIIVIASLLSAASPFTFAQEPQESPERKRAFDLLQESKFTEALPLFQKLAEKNPEDGPVILWLGFLWIANAKTRTDPEQRKADRIRGRSYLVRAKQLGESNNLSESMLKSIPADGSDDVKFSPNPKAEEAMNAAEAEFTRGEFDKAIKLYTRALELDPKLYEAALFSGDMEYRKGMNSTDPETRSDQFDKAGVWYTKAIAIDPDRETAYRYWGDALLRQGKADLALAKFIEAIVAEPYSSLVFDGIQQWADQERVQLGHPRIDIPSSVTAGKPGEVNISIDSTTLGKDDGSSAWLMYGIVRAQWLDPSNGGRSKKFAKAYPNETRYRHSLAEELEALQLVAESVETQAKEKPAQALTVSLQNLVKLRKAGLLEPYILFVRPDKGIVEDYPAYRKANRDKLKRYWMEIVVLQK